MFNTFGKNGNLKTRTSVPSDSVSRSGEGNQTSVVLTMVKGLSYISCRNENSIPLDNHVHGRHSCKYGDKQSMPALWLDVLLQTKSLPTVPRGVRWYHHQSCEAVQTICRVSWSPCTDCQGAEGVRVWIRKRLWLNFSVKCLGYLSHENFMKISWRKGSPYHDEMTSLLKIETRLIKERFVSVMGDSVCHLEDIDSPSMFNVICLFIIRGKPRDTENSHTLGCVGRNDSKWV